MKFAAKTTLFVLSALLLAWLGRELSRPYWDQELIETRARHQRFFDRHAEIEGIQKAWRRFHRANATSEMSLDQSFERYLPKHYKEVNWLEWGQPLTYEELKRKLVPEFAETIPRSDFTGFSYEFRVKDDVLAIRHPGCNGKFEATSYTHTIHKMEECSGDTVLVGGSFIQWIYVPADEGEY